MDPGRDRAVPASSRPLFSLLLPFVPPFCVKKAPARPLQTSPECAKIKHAFSLRLRTLRKIPRGCPRGVFFYIRLYRTERVYHSPGDPEQNKKRRVDKTPRFFVAYTVVFCFIRQYSFVYVRILFIRLYSTVYASIRFFTCFQSFKI